MDFNYFFGLVFAIILLAGVVVHLFVKNKHMKKKNDGQKFSTLNDDFDERQLSARNNAYKYTFFILIFYIILCAALDIGEIKWAQTSVQMFIGLTLSAVVFTVICILKDAYLGISERLNVTYVLLLLAVVGLNAYIFIIKIINGDTESIISDGKLDIGVFPFLLAIDFLAIAVAFVVKYFINKR
ncbi:MAG: hypothetical protein J1E41_07300, partial [Ruminococcus sp.]|nr:hypothetical protein [Ruminococcus sp.]